MENPSLGTVKHNNLLLVSPKILVEGNEKHMKQNLNRANFEMSQSWKAFGRKYA